MRQNGLDFEPELFPPHLVLVQRGDRATMAVSGCPHRCDYHRSLVEPLRQFFQEKVVALILQELLRLPVL